MTQRYLITSALPYINGIKHLGNLIGSMLPADVYARYLRQRGYEVLLICGTDEHGTPAELAAAAAKLDVAAFCEQQHRLQAEICERFSLSFDHFGRTSAPQNHVLTKHFAAVLEQNGYIEARSTRQIYSRADQRFLPDRYVVGTCPHCGFTNARGDQCDSCTRVLDAVDLIQPRSAVSGSTELEVRETRHLFLLQSKLAEQVQAWLDTRVGWNQLTLSIARKWLEEGLQDRSITRDLSWGVPVEKPGFEGKVFYVWFDAPIGYLAATKEWSDKDPARRDWKSWWAAPQDVVYTQFMAKDNVPFHTISFPATVLGSREGWKLPDVIKGFSWLTYEGGKFSTSSQRGIFMDAALELLPADYWRFYLLANAPEGQDFNFAWEHFAATVNKDLVGVIGNLVNRTTTFASSRFEGRIPPSGPVGEQEQRLQGTLGEALSELETQLGALEFKKASQALRSFWAAGNVYLDATAPWKAIKTDPARAGTALRNVLNLIRIAAIVSRPFIPEASAKICEAFALTEAEQQWPSSDLKKELDVLPAGRSFQVPPLLFRPLEAAEVAQWRERFDGTGVVTRSKT
ncbi:MAG TPA: methionine--tRNA ligase [Polyangiaceae bacterium]|jgi:methionyl-tRNA synthetase|nr:methionine--tRNA ligase [Polyangiaceae bacterium]